MFFQVCASGCTAWKQFLCLCQTTRFTMHLLHFGCIWQLKQQQFSTWFRSSFCQRTLRTVGSFWTRDATTKSTLHCQLCSPLALYMHTCTQLDGAQNHVFYAESARFCAYHVRFHAHRQSQRSTQLQLPSASNKQLNEKKILVWLISDQCW